MLFFRWLKKKTKDVNVRSSVKTVAKGNIQASKRRAESSRRAAEALSKIRRDLASGFEMDIRKAFEDGGK